MTQPTQQDAQQRAAFTQGLRDLAEFLDTHPEIPVPATTARLSYFPEGTDAEERAEVDRIAGILGVEPTGADSTHYTASRHFGPIAYRVIAILAEEMERYHALMSYGNAVQPETMPAATR